jgi:Ankyrin repeat
MTTPGRFSKPLKIFGFLYFAFNFVIFVVICILAIYTTGKYRQFSPAWIYLLIPGIGMLSGHWICTGKYGWARSLVMAVSLVCSSAVLFIAFVAGPQMDELKAEKFKKMQADQKHLLDEHTERMFLGVYAEDINTVKEQLAKGVDVNALNKTKQTALHVTQNADIARLLIARGTNIHARDDMGMTPIFNKEVPIAGMLLDAGADIDAKSAEGNTLFLWYTYSGYLDGINFLVARGADVNACNADQHNAVDIAKHFHPNSDIIKYLQTLNIQDCKTP